jgi:hypothetical protein
VPRLLIRPQQRQAGPTIFTTNKSQKHHPGPAIPRGTNFTITSAIGPAIPKGHNKTSKLISPSKPFHKQRQLRLLTRLRRRCPPNRYRYSTRLFDVINFTGKRLAPMFVGHLSFACRVCHLFTLITGVWRDSRFSGQYPVVSIQWKV